MVFTEQTGLRNLYAIAAYCLDSERYGQEFEIFDVHVTIGIFLWKSDS